VEISTPLSVEELAAIDATYEPIPAFGEWLQAVPRADLWDRAKSELDSLRERPLPEDALESAIRTAMRAAAFDTGAIEGLYKTDRGLTMTVATQAATWQAELADQEPDARVYFDAQLQAYDLVLDVATQARPVTEVWIRQLHEVLTGPQETYEVQTPVGPQQRPLPRGRYKSDPNHVQLAGGTIHPYAPVNAVSPEMARLVDEIGSDEFVAAHPVTQASYVHYCLVAIHPFADGNGRVARAVASTYFYRATSVPLLILAEQRSPYFAALEAADQGNTEPFIKFIGEAGRDAIGMVTEALRTALAPSPAVAVRELGTLLSAQGGLTHLELDAIGNRLQNEIQAMVRDIVNSIELPPGVTGTETKFGNAEGIPGGYRAVAQEYSGAGGTSFYSGPPAQAAVPVGIAVVVSVSDDEEETFMLYDMIAARNRSPAPEHIVLGLHDVYPELSTSAQFRVRAYVERLIGNALAELVLTARGRLVESGHRLSPDASPGASGR
jgi:Fic family protein